MVIILLHEKKNVLIDDLIDRYAETLEENHYNQNIIHVQLRFLHNNLHKLHNKLHNLHKQVVIQQILLRLDQDGD